LNEKIEVRKMELKNLRFVKNGQEGFYTYITTLQDGAILLAGNRSYAGKLIKVFSGDFIEDYSLHKNDQ